MESSYTDDPAIWKCLKPWMEPLACGKAFYFDARGDLTINVGDKINDKTRVYEFVVCSRSLARWSSVLCAMLFSGFAESRPRNRAPWIIEMPEDSVSPMFLLLVVTEKYDMARILKPWASSWFQPYTLSHTPLSEGKAINLWIAWELGHTETFQAYAEELVLKSRINDEGMLLDSDGIALDTYLFLEPPGIIDRIKLIRETNPKASKGKALVAIVNTAQKKQSVAADKFSEVSSSKFTISVWKMSHSYKPFDNDTRYGKRPGGRDGISRH
ncbi:hypothetical protein CSUB01_09299 [Colletotrichum sublineola]|uniref:Uncharacterized protein n=1 Tax=Colletotrichum sublineola TaxID=1173701 RepID=A0A066XAC6_COLSU|nr:hypothetical protein CSUB01_09299 [Colletotrichum sublineola]